MLIIQIMLIKFTEFTTHLQVSAALLASLDVLPGVLVMIAILLVVVIIAIL